MMEHLSITADSPGRDLASIAISLHRVTGMMPVIMKSRNGRAVMADQGAVMEISKGPCPLDAVFKGEEVACVRVEEGKYEGINMYISAIRDDREDPIAAVGIIDTSGLITLKEFMDTGSRLEAQTMGK